MPRTETRLSTNETSIKHMTDIVRKLAAVLAICLPVTFPSVATGQQAAPEPTLFENVRVFDGIGDTLSEPVNVLVRDGLIESISPETIAGTDAATIIDGDGRTLMPGLIDAHVHLFMETIPVSVAMAADPNYIAIRAGVGAKAMLLRGFTSVRDLAGPVFGLKRAIDEGLVAGPRIWPSGAMISQTSGHGDYRSVNDLPRWDTTPASQSDRLGFTALGDGVPEVLRRVREQLMRGASQIKLAAGGGVASPHGPIDVSQFTEAEIRAAVEAAEDWGTYVTVHGYTPEAVQTAIAAGAKGVEHGHLVDSETALMMAENDVWWSLQPFLDDQDAIPFPEGSVNRSRQLMVIRGTDIAYGLAKEYGVKLAWGTDTLFDPVLATRQGAQLAKMTRWFTPAEVLRMATSNNAELLALSGNRAPYPGRLGVVEEGALADLLLVDGDPLANIDLIADPDNMLVIMKDGRIHKDTVPD